MSQTVTITLSRQDASLVNLALLYLDRERRKAPEHAALLPEAQRPEFIASAADDRADLQRIKRALDATLAASVRIDFPTYRPAHPRSTVCTLVRHQAVRCEHWLNQAEIALDDSTAASFRFVAQQRSEAAFELVRNHVASNVGRRLNAPRWSFVAALIIATGAWVVATMSPAALGTLALAYGFGCLGFCLGVAVISIFVGSARPEDLRPDPSPRTDYRSPVVPPSRRT